MWAELESVRGLLSVPVVWRDRLGDSFDPAKSLLLQRSSTIAHFYPCPRACGCAHRVFPVHETDSPPSGDSQPGRGAPAESFIAVCQCDEPSCPNVHLTAEDVTLWELSWAKLARHICAALSLNHKPADFGLLNTRQIGSWSSTAVPVVLTIQSERAWFRTVALELGLRLKSPLILLAPTATHLDAVTTEILTASSAEFFALENILRLNSTGSFESVVTPGTLFAKFRSDPTDTDSAAASRAFALVQRLEREKYSKPPSAVSVFRLYCIDGLSAAQVAKRCRCSRGTVRDRLRLIENETGLPAERLRQMSPHLSRIDDELADSGAEDVYRRNLIQ